MARGLKDQRLERLEAQARTTLTQAGVDAFDGDQFPPLASIRPPFEGGAAVDDVECLFPAGFYSIPLPTDDDGEPIAQVIGGIRSGAVAVVITDPRLWPEDAISGECGLLNGHGIRLALTGSGVEVTGGKVDAPGYKAGGSKGLTGQVSIPTPAGAALLNFKGGIFISAGGQAIFTPSGS